MKRIVSLMLCLLMLVPMFASCSSEEPVETIETTVREAVTLGMYVITENETTAEAAQAVEDAIKSLVKSKYTTNLEIEFLTEAEYYSTVEARLAKMESGAEASLETEAETDTGAGTATDKEAVTTAATIVNEYGVTELKYPDLGANQIDIIMIADYDKYLEYADKGWLYNLDDTIKNASKKLTDYIYPAILESAKINGTYYAVPNNKAVSSEGTYMIVDKALAKEFELDASKVDSIYDLKSFFAWVKENKADVTPIAGNYDALDVAYMNVDCASRAFTEEFSLVGKYGSDTVADAESLFANENYKKDLLSMAEMKFAGYFGDANAESFAAAIKTGDALSMAEYSENYEIIALDSVYGEASELCSSMFAVSKFTNNFDRVMEVITLLNTDEELRNLLQYGIEEINYELDEETGALIRLNNDYMMDIYKTGNVYMAYPEEGMPLNIWEMAKKQNLVSSAYVEDAFGGFVMPEDKAEVVNPDTGEVTEAAFTVDFASADALARASAELKAALGACSTYADYEALVNGAAEKYADAIANFLSIENANTPYALYKAQ